tara:strand:+ start:336 stop:1607 length:1272 start_codon:yes stop_codon:yes gene_type:complete
MEAIALVDGNNFYASCEQSINPSLRGKPLVVLSNNDGCIIARSSEARALRIKMGVPYFKVKEKLKKEKVVVLSSNYSLYGDMSRRLMNLLTKYCEQIEIYSIDEAFISINRPHDNNLYPWAREIRTSIYQKLGINITVGIGSNKLRSKLANRLAKKINTSSGIFDLEKINNEDEYLRKIKIENIWGIGYQTSKWLQSKGIKNAKELKEMNQYEIKKKLGIVGERIQLELKGYKCLPIEKVKKSKKEIRVSRSFGKPITKLEDLKQALSIYTITAAEKMRLQNLQASTVTIFTRTSHYSNSSYQKSAHKILIESTNNTIYLLKIVLELSKDIYHPDYKLAKAGVIMQDLTPHNYSQKSIINYPLKGKSERERDLIKTIDFINKRFKSEKITWGITVKKGSWKMNRNLLSGISTTNISRIPTIII